MPGALEGIKVVDLTAMITGPFATMILADQGADVVKIEPPGIGDVMRFLGSHRAGMTALFASCNRSKKCVVVNIREDEGKAIVRDLVRDADVFIQNFRHGVIDRLGLGETELRESNPDLIYVSLTAFGEKGPYAGRPAYDHILQGMTGAAYVQSDPPEYMRQTWCDKITAVMTAQAITAALFARSNGAGGQHLKLSMLDAGISFLWPDGHANTMLLEEDATILPPISETYHATKTADGYATIAAVTEQQWTNLLIAMGREQMLADPRFATTEARLANLNEFREELSKGADEISTQELTDRLGDAEVPCGPVLRPTEVPEFEQVVANDSMVESDHPVMGRIREPRPPVRFEKTPSEIRNPARSLGQDTDDVLRALGRDDATIARLRESGIVG